MRICEELSIARATNMNFVYTSTIPIPRENTVDHNDVSMRSSPGQLLSVHVLAWYRYGIAADNIFLVFRVFRT